MTNSGKRGQRVFMDRIKKLLDKLKLNKTEADTVDEKGKLSLMNVRKIFWS